MNRRNTKRHFRPAVIETLEHRLALSVTPEPSAAIAVTELDAPELPELDIRVSTQADLDGNGSPDLLVGTGMGLSVFFDIDSSDQPPIRIDYASSAVQSIEVADINGDLVEDVVVGTEFEVLVYVNNGNTPGGSWAGLGVPSGVAAEGGFAHVADVTGDDIADLIVDLNVRFDVLAGLGDGEFGEPISFASSTANRPRAFALGDVNGDNAVDVAAYNLTAGAVEVWANDGAGFFEEVIESIDVPTRVAELVDTDGDGALDLIVDRSFGSFSSVEVWSGVGDGTFSDPVQSRVAGSIAEISTADFDDNGTIDIAVRHDGMLHDIVLGNVDGGISIVRANVDGGLTPAVRVIAGTRSAMIVDDTSNQVSALAPGIFEQFQFENESDFSFAAEIFPLDGQRAKNLSVFVDANQDGFLDVVATKTGFLPENSLTLFLADGEGGFVESDTLQLDFSPLSLINVKSDQTTIALSGRGTDGSALVSTISIGTTGEFGSSIATNVTLVDADIKTADLNADGLSDFLVREDEFSFRVWLGADEGLLAGEQIRFSDVLLEDKIADVNNDGNLDVVLLTSTDPLSAPVSRLSIHAGSGDGTFALSSAIPTTSSTFDVADVSGDGRFSLLIPTQSTVFALAFNDGFSVEFSVSSPGQVNHLRVVDVNGDDDADIVMASEGGQFLVALAQQDGYLLTDVFELGHQVDEVAVDDFDADGSTDLLVVGFGTSDRSTGAFYTGSTEATASLLAGESSGFGAPVRYTVSMQNPTGVVLDDIDDDGDSDVLFGSQQGIVAWQYGGVLGDLNGDSRVSLRDIDVLSEAIRMPPPNDDSFDLNRDGVIDSDDLDFLVEDIIGTKAGDTELDGRVDFADFLQFAANFGDEAATWSEGDFNGDGKVNFQDFIILASNFGFER